MARLIAKEIIAELKQEDMKLYAICLLFLQGYDNKEIMEGLHIAKSTFYDGIKRMRQIAKKYI